MDQGAARSAARWPCLVTPAVHLVLVVPVAASYWSTVLRSDEGDANIGAGLVLIVLALLALPWSGVVEFWWSQGTSEVAAVLYTTAAVVNVVLHALTLLAIRRRAGRAYVTAG